YLDNDLVRTVFRAPASVLTNNDVCLRLIAEGDPVLRQIRTDRGIGATGVSAAASRALLEFLFKAEYAYDYGMPQWVARIDHVLSSLHLERLFLGRHKFHHFRIWYRDVLPRYVRDMLLDPRTLSRPYIERKGLEAVVDGHLKGGRNYTTDIHTAVFPERFDCLFVRSCSLYNTAGFAADDETTRELLRHVKPNGTFIFAYNSNFSSRPSPTWRYHSLADVRAHFRRYPNARIFFSTRIGTWLLRRYALGPLATRLNVLVSGVSGMGGDLVCILNNPARERS